MKLFLLHSVCALCAVIYAGMSTKGKKIQQNHSNSIMYFSKSIVWNEILYFHSYWKKKHNNHRQYVWENPGRSSALSFSPCRIPVVSYRCLPELLSTCALICSALRGVFFLFLTYNLFSLVPNPCWKSYSFLDFSANLFIFLFSLLKGKERKILPMSLQSVAQVAVYPALAWNRLSLLFISPFSILKPVIISAFQEIFG